MNYLGDLDKNIELAERSLASLEKAKQENWSIVYDISVNDLERLLRSIRYCISCAKRGKVKLDSSKKFKCYGGCVRTGQFEKFAKTNKRMWYLLNWTRLNDNRYK